jgi:inner membrane protein
VDNVTHTLTGLMLARAGLNRFTPRAAAVLMVAANIPDCDVVSGLWGWLAHLRYHRWLAHSLLFVPVMAFLAVLLVAAFGWKRVRWGPAYAIAIVGVLSHLLLDWTNSYGIRLLAPFSERWFHCDITNVVDLWSLVALVLALAGPALARLVSTEIGAKRGSGRVFAILALAFIAIYDFGRYTTYRRAIDVMESRLYQGVPPVRVSAAASAVDPLFWRGIVETGSFVRILPVDLLDNFDPDAGHIFYKPPPSEAMTAARSTPAFRKFLAFSQLPFWTVTPVAGENGVVRVEVSDLRFGPPGHSSFSVSAIVDSSGHVKDAGHQRALGGKD